MVQIVIVYLLASMKRVGMEKLESVIEMFFEKAVVLNYLTNSLETVYVEVCFDWSCRLWV